MLPKHLLICVACAAALGGCASAPPPVPKAPPTIASLMSDAEAAIAMGNTESGVSLFKSTAHAFPSEKGPRLRAAQVQFDCHNYGEAIMHSQEVLDRDADDMMAHSIMAASGLRVSSRALTELAARNNLTGSVRAEAQDLAKMLRENIKGPIIPLVNKPNPKPGPTKLTPQANAPIAQVKGSGTLEGWLKNEQFPVERQAR